MEQNRSPIINLQRYTQLIHEEQAKMNAKRNDRFSKKSVRKIGSMYAKV